MIKNVNFIEGSKYYIKLMNIFFNELKIFLDIKNIPYVYNSHCIENSINIITHLEEEHLQNINFGVGKSVVLIHGMADKGYPSMPQCKKCINEADLFIAPTTEFINVYINAGVAPEKIKLCGNLKIDYLLKLQKDIIPIENSVCYAPNHNNNTNKLSSYPDFLTNIEVLKKNYNVIISPHPYNNNNIPTDYNLCNSKIIISDPGSVSYEAMILDKPVIFLDYISKKYVIENYENTLEAKIFNENIGYHITSKSKIKEIVDNVNDLGICESQTNFINELYPNNLRGNSGMLIVNEFEKLLSYE